jgi:hypothetical protein
MSLALTCAAVHLYGFTISIAAVFVPDVKVLCYMWAHGRALLQYSACIIELQISAGFVAVVYQSQKSFSVLRRSIPATFVLSLCLVPVELYFNHTNHESDSVQGKHRCTETAIAWDIIILVFWVSGTILYAIGMFGTRHLPKYIRKRACTCALLYSMTLLVTQGLLATQDLLHDTGPAWDYLTLDIKNTLLLGAQILCCLNGFFVVLIYVLLTWSILGSNVNARFATEVGALATPSEPESTITSYKTSCDPSFDAKSNTASLDKVGSLHAHAGSHGAPLHAAAHSHLASLHELASHEHETIYDHFSFCESARHLGDLVAF